MKLPTQRAPFFMGAAAALMLVFSTAAVYPPFSQTGDPTPTPGAETPAAPKSDSGTDGSTGTSKADKALGRHGISGASDEGLAEALGISTDDLQAAYLTAANAALDQAVEQDLLTQTQADNLRQRLESASGSGFHLGGRGFGLFGSDEIDGEALLAEALGISTDDLQAAYDKAEAAALAQAVTDGQLTQDQADLLTARRALQEYWATQQQSYEEIVQAAVDAGAITQEQADLLLQNQPTNGRSFGLGGLDFGRGMPGMGGDFGGRGNSGRGMMPSMPGMPGMGGDFGGRGGHGMRGAPGGQGSDSQDSQQDDSSSQSDTSLTPNFGL